MTRRLSEPPVLQGFTHVGHLGGGGFADVFLYHQESLNRKVAVKVLLADASVPAVRQQFKDEGTLMAALSSHPNIVSIFTAAIADDGRPYLVMEYCSRDNLSKRYRAAPMSVADVLATGVQLAGAVETAHRAGIVHRDIKPANVLTTDYGRPALTDFGISVNFHRARGIDQVGLSIPWSPPEMLSEEAWGDERSDVYSLAATVYSMLARRSPFELPGHANGQVELYGRIQRQPVPAVGRSDMPASLERVLQRGMAKLPANRFATALEFATELQAIEDQLGFTSTRVDVLDDDPVAVRVAQRVNDDGRTRVRQLITIDPSAPAGHASARIPPQKVHPDLQSAESRLRPAPAEFDDEPDRTMIRRPVVVGTPVPVDVRAQPPEPAVEPAVRTASRWPKVLVGALGVLVVAGVAVVLLTRGTKTPDPPVDNSITVPTLPVAAVAPAPVTDLRAASSSSGITFSWTDPAPSADQYYKWQRTDPGADPTSQLSDQPTATVSAPHACIVVYVVRRVGGETSTPSAEYCAGQG